MAFARTTSFYYLTGWSEPGAAVVIASPVEATRRIMPARPYVEVLYLPAHNVSQEKWTGPKLGPESPQAHDMTGFDRVEVLDKMRDDLVTHPAPAARHGVLRYSHRRRNLCIVGRRWRGCIAPMPFPTTSRSRM